MISLGQLARGSYRRVQAVSCLLLLLLFSQVLQAIPLSEAQAKSALIYNLLKHTHWPTEKQLKHVELGFYGDNDALYDKLAGIAPQLKVHGLPVRVRKIKHLGQIPQLQALVVSPEVVDLEPIWQEIGTRAILLITEKAKKRNAVMVNLIYPEANRLGFEVNRTNVLDRNLVISRDVLLYGGTEIEVASLYREMETALIKIKTEVHSQKQILETKLEQLQQQEAKITQQNTAIRQQQQRIAQQQQQVNQQRAKLADIQHSLKQKTKQLQVKEQGLELVAKALDENRSALHESQALVRSKAQAVAQLSESIRNNARVLAEQREEIKLHEATADEHQQVIVKQEATIESQRNVILFVLFLLFMFMLGIIIRQSRTLKRERALLRAEEEFNQAQAESISAYQASLKVKNDFLTAINHELRTPMHGILGALQLANTSNLESANDALGFIDSSAKDMMHLVDDIITYTEIQADELKLDPQPVKTAEFFERLHSRYLNESRKKSLQLIWLVDEDMPACLELDARYLAKALEKLLDNAVKFTLDGWVRFEARYKSNALVIMVEDSGAGIDAPKQRLMMEAFRQQEEGLQRRFRGLGIGLSIAYKIIQIMQGKLELESEPDRGCCWKISCPSKIASHAVHSLFDQAQAKQQIVSDLAPVLIVEDNEVNQIIMAKMLQRLGYPRLIASDGAQALELLEQHQVSLILMDLQMPVMDGFECTRHIRSLANQTAKTPILALSANLSDEQKQACLDVGMDNYLAKPVDLETLKAALLAYTGKPKGLPEAN